MYGLQEVGILAFEQLVTKLAPHGYKPAPFTPRPLAPHHEANDIYTLRG